MNLLMHMQQPLKLLTINFANLMNWYEQFNSDCKIINGDAGKIDFLVLVSYYFL